MSTNGYQSDTNIPAMNTKDLEVGQTLVQVTSYGYGTSYTFTEWTVAKVLKTRLVLTRPRVVATGAKAVEVRVLVEYSKTWPYRNGDVQTTREGEASRYGNPINLYTTDDHRLPALREMNEHLAAKRTAVDAAEKITKNTITVESATAAIEALQAWIATQK